jgi:hypothetical protein
MSDLSPKCWREIADIVAKAVPSQAECIEFPSKDERYFSGV